MKVAIYPGSFNPWHEGHEDILRKALQVFDVVYIAIGRNPDKPATQAPAYAALSERYKYLTNVNVVMFNGLLADYINKDMKGVATAIIRGLRNGQDLEAEKTQQYWNEDLGIAIPTMYFITDRKLLHISSSAVRTVNFFKKKEV